MSLSAAESVLSTALVAAMEAGASGDKQAVANAMAAAIKTFVMSGVVSVSGATASTCTAGGAVGTCIATGSMT